MAYRSASQTDVMPLSNLAHFPFACGGKDRRPLSNSLKTYPRIAHPTMRLPRLHNSASRLGDQTAQQLGETRASLSQNCSLDGLKWHDAFSRIYPIGSKMHLTLASSLVTIVAVLTSCLAYIFDWNETHVYNPNWPPHAKFHNAQTLLLSTLLGLVSLIFLWGKHDLRSAILTCSLYWIAQLGSLAFPGTALIDPEFRNRRGGRAPMQPLLAMILLSFLITACIVV
jgi:hypothetical protein